MSGEKSEISILIDIVIMLASVGMMVIGTIEAHRDHVELGLLYLILGCVGYLVAKA